MSQPWTYLDASKSWTQKVLLDETVRGLLERGLTHSTGLVSIANNFLLDNLETDIDRLYTALGSRTSENLGECMLDISYVEFWRRINDNVNAAGDSDFGYGIPFTRNGPGMRSRWAEASAWDVLPLTPTQETIGSFAHWSHVRQLPALQWPTFYDHPEELGGTGTDEAQPLNGAICGEWLRETVDRAMGKMHVYLSEWAQPVSGHSVDQLGFYDEIGFTGGNYWRRHRRAAYLEQIPWRFRVYRSVNTGGLWEPWQMYHETDWQTGASDAIPPFALTSQQQLFIYLAQFDFTNA